MLIIIFFFFCSFLFTEDNITNNFKILLHNANDFIRFKGVPRATCPNETDENPLDEFPEIFTGK